MEHRNDSDEPEEEQLKQEPEQEPAQGSEETLGASSGGGGAPSPALPLRVGGACARRFIVDAHLDVDGAAEFQVGGITVRAPKRTLRCRAHIRKGGRCNRASALCLCRARVNVIPRGF